MCVCVCVCVNLCFCVCVCVCVRVCMKVTSHYQMVFDTRYLMSHTHCPTSHTLSQGLTTQHTHTVPPHTHTLTHTHTHTLQNAAVQHRYARTEKMPRMPFFHGTKDPGSGS